MCVTLVLEVNVEQAELKLAGDNCIKAVIGILANYGFTDKELTLVSLFLVRCVLQAISARMLLDGKSLTPMEWASRSFDDKAV